jgi:4-carboxymuconolactone decarboxylase
MTASLDDQTRELIGFAAVIARGREGELRAGVARLLAARVSAVWVEELLLQSLLMTGYPRTLVATRAWRDGGGPPAPGSDPDAEYHQAAAWTERGERTCATVYGDHYGPLREHVRQLHPALDAWMITEGYGRTLGRPGLDLVRRELCVVAQTAVLEAPRQLHSHLRGALNAGAPPEQVEGALALVRPLLEPEWADTAWRLWVRIRDGR